MRCQLGDFFYFTSQKRTHGCPHACNTRVVSRIRPTSRHISCVHCAALREEDIKFNTYNRPKGCNLSSNGLRLLSLIDSLSRTESPLAIAMALLATEDDASKLLSSCEKWANYPTNLVHPSEFEHELVSYRDILNNSELFLPNPRKGLRMLSLATASQGESCFKLKI